MEVNDEPLKGLHYKRKTDKSFVNSGERQLDDAPQPKKTNRGRKITLTLKEKTPPGHTLLQQRSQLNNRGEALLDSRIRKEYRPESADGWK